MDNDAQLVTRIRSGDVTAFEQLMSAYEKKVYSMALNMSGSAEDAFDLSQEIFLRVYRSVELFKMESSLSTWIYRIASNACIDFVRRKKKRSEVPLVISQDDETYENEIPDARFCPETQYEKTEFIEQLKEGLARLSSDQRQIVVMRDINGLSYQEISDALEIEEGTVKSRLFRAREQLRRLMSAGNITPAPASNQKEKR